jgi:hypothetical protein
MLVPLLVCFLVFARLSARDAFFWTVLSNATTDGKRRRAINGLMMEK